MFLFVLFRKIIVKSKMIEDVEEYRLIDAHGRYAAVHIILISHITHPL